MKLTNKYSIVWCLVYGFTFTNIACVSGLDKNGTTGETVDGELLVMMGRQIKQPLLTLIGMAIRNLHQCAEWTTWTACTSNGRLGNFGTINRTRTCNKSTTTENTKFENVEHDIRLCEGFCPSSYNWTENGFCVKLNNLKNDWDQAERICQDEGGHLALIDSDSKFNDVKKMLEGITEYVWVDGRRKDNNSPWENVHGIHLNKFYWHSSQPNNGSNELCVVLRNDNTREWHDATCTSKHISLCEIAA
jgi:hypothetical protein